MKKTITNSIIGLLFSGISFIGYTVFTTSQQNKQDSIILQYNIKDLNNNIKVFTAAVSEQTNTINKRIDQLNDTIISFQRSNLKEHSQLVNSNSNIIRYLRITDKRFKELFNDLAINETTNYE